MDAYIKNLPYLVHIGIGFSCLILGLICLDKIIKSSYSIKFIDKNSILTACLFGISGIFLSPIIQNAFTLLTKTSQPIDLSITLLGLVLTILGGTVIKIMRDSLIDVREAKEGVLKTVRHNKLEITRLQLYLETLGEIQEASFEADSNPNKEFEIQILESINKFYAAHDENQISDSALLLSKFDEGTQNITNKGWNYIRELAELHNRNDKLKKTLNSLLQKRS